MFIQHVVDSVTPAGDWHSLAIDLVMRAPTVFLETPCGEAFDILVQNDDLPALCVIDQDGRVAGLVSRQQYLWRRAMVRGPTQDQGRLLAQIS